MDAQAVALQVVFDPLRSQFAAAWKAAAAIARVAATGITMRRRRACQGDRW